MAAYATSTSTFPPHTAGLQLRTPRITPGSLPLPQPQKQTQITLLQAVLWWPFSLLPHTEMVSRGEPPQEKIPEVVLDRLVAVPSMMVWVLRSGAGLQHVLRM